MSDETPVVSVETPQASAASPASALQDLVNPAGETQTPGETAKPDEGETEPEQGRKKHWAQRRIDELTRDKRTLERALDAAMSGRKEPEPADTAKKSAADKSRPWADASDPKPRLSTFDGDLDQFEDAKDDWYDREFDRKQAYQAKQRETESAQKTQTQKWEETKDALATELEDFEDVTEAAVQQIRSLEKQPGIPALAAIATHPEFGPRFLYELGKNPAELKRLAALDPVSIGLEAGAIRARLAQEKTQQEEAKTEPPPPPPVSRAPKPPTPISKPSSAKAPDINDPNLSFKEFVKLREAQKAKG